MAGEKLTAKQKKVLKSLEKGKSVKDIAKAMKTGTNNVYGHMRRLRQLGYLSENNEPMQGEGVGLTPADPPDLPPLPSPPEEETAPTPEHNQIDQLLKDSTKVIDVRVAEIHERIQDIGEETHKIELEMKLLGDEADALLQRKAKIAQAL